MATLDEVFAAMGDTSEKKDDALCFLVDENLRIITVPAQGVVLGVEGDKDVNRVRFKMNRFYRGEDLAEFTIRINYRNADGELNYYTVTEKTAGEEELDFVWLVAADAVAAKGTVYFIVNCFVVNDEGVIQKAYHTTLGSAQSLEGLTVNLSTDEPEIIDFITHVKKELSDYAGGFVEQAGAHAKAAEDSAKQAEQISAGISEHVQAAANSAAKAEESKTAAEQAKEKTEIIANAVTGVVAQVEAASTAAQDAASHATENARKAAESEERSAALKEVVTAAAEQTAEKAGNVNTAAETVSTTAAAVKAAAERVAALEEAMRALKTAVEKSEAATREYFEQVRTITVGAQGWYATPEALKAAVPIGENGWWAVVGSTDTIWTWDSDSNAWVNSGAQVDLSDYLTQTQVKKLLEGYMPLRAATAEVMGGVKVGSGLIAEEDGTLNAAVIVTEISPDDLSEVPAFPEGTLWIQI